MEMDRTRQLLWIVWPAFLVAGVAAAALFSLLDPTDLTIFGAPVDLSREALYTLGFIAFWIMGIASSSLTVFLARANLRQQR